MTAIINHQNPDLNALTLLLARCERKQITFTLLDAEYTYTRKDGKLIQADEENGGQKEWMIEEIIAAYEASTTNGIDDFLAPIPDTLLDDILALENEANEVVDADLLEDLF